MDVDDIMKRIMNREDTEGLIVINQEGIPVKSSLEPSQTVHYVSHVNKLIEIARSGLRGIDANDQLKVLRLRTMKNEIMVVPDNNYTLVVVQKKEGKKGMY